LPFILVHLLFFACWMIFNTVPLTRSHHFDPVPYSLLGTIVALEAILLASLIVMRQTRMSRRADERDHLMLQILLLTEKEITAVLGVDQKIAEQIGLDNVANSKEITELSQETSIDDVAETIKNNLPSA
jgi:uncharacterized membrane protein